VLRWRQPSRAVRANYEFFVLEFANIVEGNTSIQTFSDRVLIIDEAHHLRANDTSDKNVQGRHGRSGCVPT
jgi:hypothetical protein